MPSDPNSIGPAYPEAVGKRDFGKRGHNGMARYFLAFSSLILGAGGLMHAAAFNRAAAAVASASLPPFFANSFKALWLIDSATQLILAALLAAIAARPAVATRPVVLLLAFIPAATAGLIYRFVGSFFAGHLLAAAAAGILLGGLCFQPMERE
jgi:hypothetical protein